MNKNDDFFIGWQDEAPSSYKRLSVYFFAVTLIILLITVWVFTKSERGFIDSYFEYGTLTEIKGQLVQHPVWGIKTTENGNTKTIPLVGFGKHGADSAIAAMRENNKEIEPGVEITLRGTLFHYNERSWMELTEGEESFVSLSSRGTLSQIVANKGRRALTGEIIDPKCFFGVMNPADKAVHRSCAIRCISGGIPSLLGIRENGVFVDYYFLVNDDLKPLTKEVLNLVGLPVEISGEHWVYDDWNVLKMENASLVSLNTSIEFEDEITMCR